MIAFNPNFTITNLMTSAITQIERARGFLEAAKLSDNWVTVVVNRPLGEVTPQVEKLLNVLEKNLGDRR